MPTSRICGLVLDRDHRVLVDERGAAPALAIEVWPERPLLAFSEYARAQLRLELTSPCGSMVPDGGAGPRDFAFVVDAGDGTPPPGMRWVRLAEATRDAWVWRAYVRMMLAGWEPATRALDVFAFGDRGEMASRLAHLVTCGDKRGTAMWLRAAELDGTTVPMPGSLAIVTDGFGMPRCAIRSEHVQRLAFRDIGAELAALEGEGDLTLADWRDGHLAYFGGESAALGIPFGDDEVIVYERFRVIHIVGRTE